jgi:hypothetical protein
LILPTYHKNPYRAVLELQGKRIYLGHYVTARKAASAYDEGAKRYFGQFAYLNFK